MAREVKKSIKDIELCSDLRIHFRSAAMLIKLANRDDCELSIVKDGVEIPTKSMMEILLLATERDAQIKVRMIGADHSELDESIFENIQ